MGAGCGLDLPPHSDPPDGCCPPCEAFLHCSLLPVFDEESGAVLDVQVDENYLVVTHVESDGRIYRVTWERPGCPAWNAREALSEL